MTSAQALAHYQAVWRVTQLIPQGKVASYKLVADLAGLPGRARMIGRALGAVPHGQSVPWFRVLRSSGQIAFAPGSDAAEQQRMLLLDDGVMVRNYRVRIKTYLWQPDLDTLLHQLSF